jgi:hypothetical protein
VWSAGWHGNEARKHQIDGVVSLGQDDYFGVATGGGRDSGAVDRGW